MPEGTIKKLTDKGFGFIETGKGQDLFFHSSSVEGIDFDSLREGQRVSFTEGRGPKGPRAENVTPL
jgi:cold shock protein